MGLEHDTTSVRSPIPAEFSKLVVGAHVPIAHFTAAVTALRTITAVK